MSIPKRSGVLAALAIVGLAGCGSSADTVSNNISKDAEEFRVARRIVVTSGITDKVLYQIEGRCSFETEGRRFDVICLDDKKLGQYTKATFGLGDQDNWSSVQLGSVKVNRYRTKIIFRPEAILPDLDLVTGEQG